MNPAAFEVNFDGLVGPTHNYSGLSYGNIASLLNQNLVSNPRAAAVQGLKKMKFLFDLGLVQGLLPPHERPFIPLLRALGMQGTDAFIWSKVAKENSELLKTCCSSAAMWTANAATMTPSLDSQDHKVHFTPANLGSKLHRAIEADTTARALKSIFNNSSYFVHHPPLPFSSQLSDEGAANHTRFCKTQDAPGVHLFIWGRSALENRFSAPLKFPARQTQEASLAIFRHHQLIENNTVVAQQCPAAIDAGVFHNDVIAVGHLNVLMCHEKAFAMQKKTLREIRQKVLDVCGVNLIVIEVEEKRIPLKEAVKTYLFNSQLISLNNQKMALLAPIECEKSAATKEFLNDLIKDDKNPITEIHFIDLSESMRNGGGPACLRLRVVLTDKELIATKPTVLFNDEIYHKIKDWILKHYRDRLSLADLKDPALLHEVHTALDELTQILKIGAFYDFQRF